VGPRGLNVFKKIKMPITGVLKLASNSFLSSLCTGSLFLSNIYRLSHPVGSFIVLNVVNSTALVRSGVPSENDRRLWSAEIVAVSMYKPVVFVLVQNMVFAYILWNHYRCRRSASG
jgi:hypothetical protein